MTRRSKEDAAKTRAAIVEMAARLFRAKGIAAVSVAEIMGELGLTVGGFYKHFESKEALVAEAIEAASKKTADQLRSAAAGAGPKGDRFAAVLDFYLAPTHRNHPAVGCPVAALAAEAPREGATTRDALERAVLRLLEVVEVAGAERTAGAAPTSARTLHAVAASVGAVILSRALGDEALRESLVAAVREAIEGDDRR